MKTFMKILVYVGSNDILLNVLVLLALFLAVASVVLRWSHTPMPVDTVLDNLPKP